MFQRVQQFIDEGGASRYTIELPAVLRKTAANLLDGMIVAPDAVKLLEEVKAKMGMQRGKMRQRRRRDKEEN